VDPKSSREGAGVTCIVRLGAAGTSTAAGRS